MLGRINWHPTRRDLRYFAVTMLIAFTLASLILLLGSKYRLAGWFIGSGLIASLSCYFIPPIGKTIYLLWMALTYILGRIVSPIILAIIFYLVVTPIGLISRVFGKDRLRLKKPRDAKSHFATYSESLDKESFRRQF